jgi:hypothetical protein
MDAAWISGGATIVGAVIGLSFGQVTAYLANRREVAAQERARAHEHATWLRERRADAYVDLLGVVEQMGLWLARMYPTIQTGDGPPVPPIPTDENQIKIFARLNAYGSNKVKERHSAWRNLAWKTIRAIEAVGHGDNRRRTDLPDLRQKEAEARAELGAVISQELDHPSFRDSSEHSPGGSISERLVDPDAHLSNPDETGYGPMATIESPF